MAESFDYNLSSFIIGPKESVDSSRVNTILTNFINNDEYVYGKFDLIPGIWKCRWYNDNSISGYSKGDFVWLNTENIEYFLRDNAEEIQNFANVNPLIINKLPAWKSNDATVYEQYFNVLTGYMDDTKACPMSAMYEIGELSACNQLMVSLKHDNKDPLTTLSSWKKFLIDDENYDEIIEKIHDAVDEVIAEHEFNYHFGDDTFNESILSSLSNFVDYDFKNAKFVYPKNYIANQNHCSGFDNIEVYVKKPHPNRTLSGYTIENQWFRKWQSGYLEHGGIIAIKNYINQEQDAIKINFNWDLITDESRIYDVKYLGTHGSLISVDESHESPPGDNLISVLYELDKDEFEILGSRQAPIYANTDYTISLTPVYPNVGTSPAIVSEDSYRNLGNNSIINNVVGTNVIKDRIMTDSFSFEYTKVNMPTYYLYYVAGFTR